MTADDVGMSLALQVAHRGLDVGELPVGAVVILGDKVLAEAHTSERTERRYLVHAELLALVHFDALRLSFASRRQCALFTTVEPCMMCLGAASSAFIGSVIYSLPSQTDGATRLIRMDGPGSVTSSDMRRLELRGGVLSDRASALFRQYVDSAHPGPMRDWAQSLIPGV